MTEDKENSKKKWSVKYKLGAVYNSEAMQAQRAAVLVPLFGAKAQQANKCRKYTLQVQRLWRKWLSELRASGHKEVLATHRRRAWNCRPSFVQVMPQGLFCRQPRICPFCWARRFSEIVTKLQPLVAPDDILYVRRIAFEMPQTVEIDGEDICPLAPFLYSRTKDRPREFKFAQRSLEEKQARVGLWEHIVIYPSGNPATPYTLEVRQLWHGVGYVAALDSGLQNLPFHFSLRAYEPGGARLLEAAARMCEYPARLLRAPIEQTLPILELQKLYRFSAMLGSLRVQQSAMA